MGRGRLIGPHRESGTSLNLSPTSTLQAEVSLQWNGIHGSGSGRSSLHLQTATFHSAKSLFGAFWYFLVLFGSFFRKWFVASHSMRKKCLVHGNNMIQCNLRSLMLPFLIQLIAVAPNIKQDSAIQRRQVVFTDRPMPFAFSHSCTLPPVTLS